MGVIIGILIVFILILIAAFLVWLDSFTDSSAAYINFNKFLKYYKTNPDKWRLYDTEVKLKDGSYFQFGPIGFYRYIIWYLNNNRKKTNQELEELFGGKDETSI